MSSDEALDISSPLSPTVGRSTGLVAESREANRSVPPKRIMSTPANLNELSSSESTRSDAAIAMSEHKCAATMRPHRRVASFERSPLPAEWRASGSTVKARPSLESPRSAASTFEALASYSGDCRTPAVSPTAIPLLSRCHSMPATSTAAVQLPPATSPCVGRRAGQLVFESLQAEARKMPERTMSTPAKLNELFGAQLNPACGRKMAATTRQSRRGASFQRSPLPPEWRALRNISEAGPPQTQSSDSCGAGSAFSALGSCAEDCLVAPSPSTLPAVMATPSTWTVLTL